MQSGVNGAWFQRELGEAARGITIDDLGHDTYVSGSQGIHQTDLSST